MSVLERLSGAWNYIKTGRVAYTGSNYYNYKMEDGNHVYTLLDGSSLRRLFDSTFTEQNLVVMYHACAEIYAPVDAIASRVIKGEFVVKKFENDEIVWDNQFANKILSKPNFMQSFTEWLYEAITYEIVTGNSFIYAATPSTRDFSYQNWTGLFNLPSQMTDPKPKDRVKLYSATKMSDVIDKYTVNYGEKPIDFDTNKVLFQRTINLIWDVKSLKGLSRLMAAEQAIINLVQVYLARGKIYSKQGQLGILVSARQDTIGSIPLSPKEKNEVLGELEGRYGLDGEKSLMGVSNQPLTYLRTGMSIQELQPFDECLTDMAAIYAVLGVPFELAPKMKGETFSNQNTSEKSLYQNNVIPRAKRFCQAFTEFSGLEAEGLYLDAMFDHVEVLQDNKKEKADTESANTTTRSKQFMGGVITLNQWISADGGEEVKSGDNAQLYDKLIYQMTPEERAWILNATTDNKNDKGNGNTAN